MSNIYRYSVAAADDPTQGEDFHTEEAAKSHAKHSGGIVYREPKDHSERAEYWGGDGWYQASRP